MVPGNVIITAKTGVHMTFIFDFKQDSWHISVLLLLQTFVTDEEKIFHESFRD